MKNKIPYLITLICAVSILCSCNKEDEFLSQDNTTIGDIVKNKNVIGINQKVILACPVTLSKNAEDVKMQWTTSDGEIYQSDSYSGGISYKTLSWEIPGSYTVKFTLSYRYGTSAFKTFEKSYQLNVKKSDFRNSLFGDDIERVMSDNPNIKIGIFGYIDQESETIMHRFNFSEAKTLRSGMTEELKDNSATPNPTASLRFFREHVRKNDNGSIIWKYRASVIGDYNFTKEDYDVIYKFGDDLPLTENEEQIIGALIDAYAIELMALTKNTQIPIMLTCKGGAKSNSYLLTTWVNPALN